MPCIFIIESAAGVAEMDIKKIFKKIAIPQNDDVLLILPFL
ncbi:MAG TPA: hypothetical protein PKA54_09995 [Chitinophagaceae bacterium]|nr:hypothetical protein [Chitinophagaceae bacterium]